MTEYEYEYYSVWKNHPNTNTNIIRFENIDRIRIRIFWYSNTELFAHLCWGGECLGGERLTILWKHTLLMGWKYPMQAPAAFSWAKTTSDLNLNNEYIVGSVHSWKCQLAIAFLDTLASIGSILLSESQSVTESGSHVFEILSARLIFSRIGLKVF